MKKIYLIIIFIVWICVVLGVRIYALDKSPFSAGFDEASLGYNAYSILKTGKDEYGTPFPLSLRSFNDFKPALYSYLSIPFIYLIGLNDMSTRMPSAFLGTLSLVFLFLIIRKIGKPRNFFVDLALVGIISFFPWRLHFSRVAFESNISMAFFTGTIWCLMNFNKNWFYKLGVIIFSTLSIYSYHASRLAIPIVLALFLIDPLNTNIKKIFKNPFNYIKRLWPLFIVVILYLPLFTESSAGNLLTRYTQTNLFSHYNPFTPREITITQNPWLNPIGHPIYYLSGYISGHVLSYLSPKNLSLLIYPGVIKSAQAIGGTGMLGFFGGLLFIFGLLSNYKNFIKDEKLRQLIYWIFAGIAPAAITWEWFYPLRSLNIYPALDIIAILGLISIYNVLKRNSIKILNAGLLVGLSGIIIVSSIYNLLNEYGYGAWETAGEFQPGGFKQGVPLLMSLKDNYQTIYLDSSQAQSYEIFWYYMKYPPEKVQELAPLRNAPGVEGSPTLNFGNFINKKYDWLNDRKKNDFIYWTNSEVKEDEINSTKGAKLFKILSPTGDWIASIITKE